MSLKTFPKHRAAAAVVTAAGVGYVIYDQTSSEKPKDSSDMLVPPLAVSPMAPATLSGPSSLITGGQVEEMEEEEDDDLFVDTEDIEKELAKIDTKNLTQDGIDALAKLAKRAKLRLMQNYYRDIEKIQKVYDGKVKDETKKAEALKKRLKDLEDQLKRLEAILKFWQSTKNKRTRPAYIKLRGETSEKVNKVKTRGNKPPLRDPKTTPPYFVVVKESDGTRTIKQTFPNNPSHSPAQVTKQK